MGGRSAGQLAISGDHAVFAGLVSLANGGGFASVRCRPRDFGLAGRSSVVVPVCGDGRVYQLRLRLDDRLDGLAWRFPFPTTPGIWTEVNAPFARFEPV